MQQIELVDVKLLSKHNKNPRTITKNQLENLKDRIKKDPAFFEHRCLLVNHNTADDSYVIYAGNQRFEAARALKYKKVPCIIDKDLPQDIQNERMIADNLHHGRWDDDMLANEYSEMDLQEMGYDYPTLDDIEPDEDSQQAEEGEEPLVKFKISVPALDSPGFENQLDKLLKGFPRAIKNVN